MPAPLRASLTRVCAHAETHNRRARRTLLTPC
jgi:hypothetical protein